MRDSNDFRFFARYCVKRALTFFDVYDRVRFVSVSKTFAFRRFMFRTPPFDVVRYSDVKNVFPLVCGDINKHVTHSFKFSAVAVDIRNMRVRDLRFAPARSLRFGRDDVGLYASVWFFTA